MPFLFTQLSACQISELKPTHTIRLHARKHTMTLQTVPLLLDINKDLAQYDYVANVQYDDLTLEGKSLFDQVKAKAFDPETFYGEHTDNIYLAGLEGIIRRNILINDYYNVIGNVYDYDLLREILALKIYVDLKRDFPEVVKELEAHLDIPSKQTYEFFHVYITKNAERYERLIEATLKNTRERIEARDSKKSDVINDALEAALDKVQQASDAQRTGNKVAVQYADMKLEDLVEEPLFAPYLAAGGKTLAGKIFNSAVGRTFLIIMGAELFTLMVFNSFAAGMFFAMTLPFYCIYLLIVMVQHAGTHFFTSNDTKLESAIKYINGHVNQIVPGTSILWPKAFERYCAKNQLATTPIDKAFAIIYLQEQFEDATMLKAKLEIEKDNIEAQMDAINKFIDANVDVIEYRTDAIYERARARMYNEELARNAVDDAFNDELKKFKSAPAKDKDDIVL